MTALLLALKEVTIMNVKITYPSVKKKGANRRKVVQIFKWPFIALAIASIIVNLLVGKPYWFTVAVFGLYAVWNLFVSTDLVEYNLISQSVKALLYACILCAIIDIFLSPGFALFVIPIISFSGLAICVILFLSNIRRQKHNMLPLINLIIISIVGSILALIFNHSTDNWPYIVLLGLSAVFLVTLGLILKQDFKREFQKRFHAK